MWLESYRRLDPRALRVTRSDIDTCNKERAVTSSKTSRDRVREHRARLRAQGLRPVQFWLSDVNSTEFAERARRECEALNSSPNAEKDLAWVDSVADDYP
jgi:hypothetical protein